MRIEYWTHCSSWTDATRKGKPTLTDLNEHCGHKHMSEQAAFDCLNEWYSEWATDPARMNGTLPLRKIVKQFISADDLTMPTSEQPLLYYAILAGHGSSRVVIEQEQLPASEAMERAAKFNTGAMAVGLLARAVFSKKKL